MPDGRVEPQRRSDAIWLVRLLVRRAVSCPCNQSPSITLLRGVDRDSDERAQSLQDHLRTSRHDMKVVIDRAVPCDVLASSGQSHRCVTMDVSSSDAGLASMGFCWESLQSTQGRLVVVATDLDVTLGPGSGLTIYSSGGALVVETIEDRHGATTRLSTTPGPVDVYDHDASHLLLRDEHLLGDAPPHARLVLDPEGRIRRSG